MWPRRFREHTILDQEDFNRHCDHIHFNPVRHGLAKSPAEWEKSSFRQFVEKGLYKQDWGRHADKAIVEMGLEQVMVGFLLLLLSNGMTLNGQVNVCGDRVFSRLLSAIFATPLVTRLPAGLRVTRICPLISKVSPKFRLCFLVCLSQRPNTFQWDVSS